MIGSVGPFSFDMVNLKEAKFVTWTMVFGETPSA